jgi:ABC-type Mn2+/Zn2+ transport system permease subunit
VTSLELIGYLLLVALVVLAALAAILITRWTLHK